MEDKSFTPFFVADRQASLRILAGLKIPLGKRIGIMTHVNTSISFKTAISRFPCFDKQNCGISDGKCRFNGDLSKCKIGQELKKNTCIVCDSGVFQKNGCNSPTYERLFDEYEEIGAHYGVIMDVLKNRKKTIETAKEAILIYKAGEWKFNLVGVSQGTTVNEYLKCYKELKYLGYEYIAIGGMLKRKENSARYVSVRDESLLKKTLKAIRKFDPEGWIFALGCYAPGRHSIFLDNSVFGADYKGWIFNYVGHSPKRGNRRSQNSRYRQVRSFIDGEILSKSQTWGRRHRLLIIPCSKTKRDYRGPAQAINVYDGPLYRMLRKRIHDFSNENGFEIMIVSAKYGLITPTTLIRKYDQIMTSDRAHQIKSTLNKNLSRHIKENEYSDVLVNLGKSYLAVIEPSLQQLQRKSNIRLLEGKIGTRLRETKDWISS